MNDRNEAWRKFATWFEEDPKPDWVTVGLLPVIRLARRDPVLSNLLPYQSLSRLCFKASDPYDPYGDPYPCIEYVQTLNAYWVYDRPYDSEAGPHPIRLGETYSPEEAIGLVKQHLSGEA
jgi:hypothetical protein